MRVSLLLKDNDTVKTLNSVDALFRFTAKFTAFSQVSSRLATAQQTTVKNAAGSFKAVLVAALWKQAPTQTVILCSDEEQAEQWFSDMQLLVGKDNLCLYRETEKRVALSAEHLDAQLVGLTHALAMISEVDNPLIIATAASLGYHVPPPSDVHNNLIEIQRGQRLSYEDFISILSLNGFNRKDFVETVGDIAVRGGIVDVFAPGIDNPLRFEFFGDEIESIREFDPLSQRSIAERASVSLITHIFHNDEHDLNATLLDYMAPNALLVVDSPEGVHARFHELEAHATAEQLSRWKTLSLNPLGTADIVLETRPQPPVQASITALCKEMRKAVHAGMSIVLCADGKDQLARLKDLTESGLDTCLLDDEEQYTPLATVDDTLRHTHLLPYEFSEGFVVPGHLAVFTEHQIFMRRQANHAARHSKNSSGKGFTLREIQQLRHGDYVVHIDKGIAQFDGLETITVGGNKQESVRLIFAGGDKMYLHMNYISRLQKYSAQEGNPPALSKLHTREWERKKERTKKRLKDIARDLIKLYAQRKAQPGYAFPLDTLWQKELEASFMYEDTPDQARSTAEVKADMEKSTPMDRLVCGDVGFGKTEVAIRAAFKAVQAGKQAAVLVPTTILAQQHFLSFRDRLERYAVKVEVLSRFRTKPEQKDIVERLRKGMVDVLIGTHRILSKDVQFKDLGLLIVDEEHRFGVGAKEKLRQARVSIDTVTLTATPIPRTLNFSLMGARDISVIETPPRNRLPVHTEILSWNTDAITEAIEQELRRGGQVFFVTDRISDIEMLAETLRDMVPGLRVAIAHGGMEAKHIEDVMEQFLERKTDLLIATKIIESGIDIPNVNTMFINRAQNFGLAELYQLRGRVGRSNIQAYCYMLVPSVHSLARTALKRLQAIEEFTELGSGFNLAMRDLEIRGAGNLLGAEQSGFIADIGFELYQKILDEAVQELKEEEFAALFADSEPKSKRQYFGSDDVAVDIEGDALLPKSYIANDVERYEFYKKLYKVEEAHELNPIASELRDRFGALPPEGERLLDVIRLRIAALPTGLERVTLRNSSLLLEFPAAEKKKFYDVAFQPMITAIASIAGSRIIPKGKNVYAQLPASSLDHAIEQLRTLVEQTQQNIEAERQAE